MQTLGVIEVKGLLAGIEAADVMVKSANINIVERIFVGGGLVSITIVGDVGAVKAAIETGVSAVNRLGESLLVSSHVIARPHDDLKNIIKMTYKEKIIKEEIEAIEIVETIKEEIEDIEIIKEKIEDVEIIKEEIEILECLKIDEKKINKKYIDDEVKASGIDKAIEIIKDLKISKMRKMIREYDEIKMDNKSISKADKGLLINKIKEHYEKNNE